MLDARGLRLVVDDRALLDDVSLQLAPGEFVAVLGPNGAGKSTLMHCLSGAQRPEGFLRMDGLVPSSLAPGQLAMRRAVLEQTPSIDAPFRVAELIRLGIPRELAARRADGVVDTAMQRLDLHPLATRRVPSLSGGERLRTHMARVLAQLWAGQALGGGRYLLIDEPTASLDLRHQMTVLKAARQACREGVGVLAILHDPTLAASVADRLLLLKDGRILDEGPARQVLTHRRLSELYDMPISVRDLGDTLAVTPDYAACLSPDDRSRRAAGRQAAVHR
ncbi:ATP-binding cassette domain-containing protein [Billgrantia gudaonensis]|uniref:Iron complex transport system ATP-binding protein n=1 Tax=Billgrantia gudaonensis TaxID=376427 RepID=A0A1G8Q3I8_9GAMM|nr:ATP-binding cassette domain-containing protein [Halomonas gudaonensis]SDI99283.1 iron complex transport system ATP-binding protein [Halomonas gudaonensis]